LDASLHFPLTYLHRFFKPHHGKGNNKGLIHCRRNRSAAPYVILFISRLSAWFSSPLFLQLHFVSTFLSFTCTTDYLQGTPFHLHSNIDRLSLTTDLRGLVYYLFCLLKLAELFGKERSASISFLDHLKENVEQYSDRIPLGMPRQGRPGKGCFHPSAPPFESVSY
jgi:hypothetical protein